MPYTSELTIHIQVPLTMFSTGSFSIAVALTATCKPVPIKVRSLGRKVRLINILIVFYLAGSRDVQITFIIPALLHMSLKFAC